MAFRKETKYIVIHCSATRPSQDIDANTIDNWHRARGFFSIGYHYFIDRRGKRELGRGPDEVGAHAKGYNHISIGICLAGGVSETDHTKAENNFTEQQFTELDKLLEELVTVYPYAHIIGHNQISIKDCPSFDVQSYLHGKTFSEKGDDIGIKASPTISSTTEEEKKIKEV
jgi:N-acetylmuramoyl-L-alanine amidase